MFGVGEMVGGVLGTVGSLVGTKMQQDFSEHMRGTAYQATVKDLRAAGLNPMLAYTQGPTSSAGITAPDLAGSASQGARLAAEIKNIQQDTAKKKQDTEYSRVSTQLAASQLPAANIKAKVDKSKVGPAVNIIERILQSFSGGTSGFQFGRRK